MAILPIQVWGSSVLHRPAKPVVDFDDELRTLVADMHETMRAAPGVGLAGPQVGLPLRLFTYEWTHPRSGQHWKGVAVNPELWLSPIVPTDIDELDEDAETEGCLSVPEESYPLRRANRARMRAQNESGEWYELEAEGWLARILQHEYDHLDGIVYINRLDFVTHRRALKDIVKDGYKGGTWTPEPLPDAADQTVNADADA